ncbi:MAG: hypothetical protein M0Z53_02795 [Thermaerobacter sp.]|nr:hypothetical protein [Thermaerobacter sp.]
MLSRNRFSVLGSIRQWQAFARDPWHFVGYATERWDWPTMALFYGGNLTVLTLAAVFRELLATPYPSRAVTYALIALVAVPAAGATWAALTGVVSLLTARAVGLPARSPAALPAALRAWAAASPWLALGGSLSLALPHPELGLGAAVLATLLAATPGLALAFRTPTGWAILTVVPLALIVTGLLLL